MSSLNANKLKTNMFLVSNKLFIVRTICICHCFQADVFNNNYKNNCLFDILLCSHPLQQHVFVRYVWQRSSQPRLFSPTRLHPRLTEFLLLIVCFVLPFYMPTQTVQCRFFIQNVRVFVFSKTTTLLVVTAFLLTCLSLFHSYSFRMLVNL